MSFCLPSDEAILLAQRRFGNFLWLFFYCLNWPSEYDKLAHKCSKVSDILLRAWHGLSPHPVHYLIWRTCEVCIMINVVAKMYKKSNVLVETEFEHIFLVCITRECTYLWMRKCDNKKNTVHGRQNMYSD